MNKFESFDDYVKKNFERTPKEKVNYEIDLRDSEMGIIVAYYRHKHHLTQSDLGKLADVPQSSVARVENGGRSNIPLLVKLFSAMDESLPFKTPKEIIHS